MWFKGIEGLKGIDAIDWAGIGHAYGTAEQVPEWLHQLRSPEADTRDRAFRDLYGQVLHQDSIYEATAAVVPFVAAIADAPDTPDRAGAVAYLSAIGDSAIGQCEGEWVSEHAITAIAALRANAERFRAWSTDPDPRVRRAAAPALAWCFTDAETAAALLHTRIEDERDALTQIAQIKALAALSLRERTVHGTVVDKLRTLVVHARRIPEVRLVALAHRMECAPETAEEAAQELSRLLDAIKPREPRPAPSPPAWLQGIPPQVAQGFRELDRHAAESTAITQALLTAHGALGDRVEARTVLLLAQIHHADGPVRLAGFDGVSQLVGRWRGAHRELVLALGARLREHSRYAARAAEALEACGPMAEPARKTLAGFVERGGPGAWAAEDAATREAHQNAVRALAQLGDDRALPSMCHAFESRVDTWRAVQVAGGLRNAATVLAPLVAHHLSGMDIGSPDRMSANAAFTALASLGDPAAVPAVIDATETAARAHQTQGPSSVPSGLKALAAFGPAAAHSANLVSELRSSSDPEIRAAAVDAWWRITGDREGTKALAADLLDAPSWFAITDGAGLLAELGPEAASSLPRLRDLLGHSYHWVRVKVAAALWDIGGAQEAPLVLATMRMEWAKERAVASEVVPALDRMGEAARPLLDLVEAELAEPVRGPFLGIAADEQVVARCRAIVARLAD